MQRIAIVSGKGGVGKSTVTVGLAAALRDLGAAVGVLDADLYGPDIPRMFGLARTEVASHIDLTSKRRLAPVEAAGVKVMSVQFLIAEEQAVAWVSSLANILLDRLLNHTAWGELDFLIIDLPPGTADIQQRIVESANLSGALVVVTPHDVAHLDAKKVVEMLRRANVTILGGIENMSGLTCPHCGEHVTVAPEVDQSRSVWAVGVDRVLTLPLDPAVAGAAHEGVPLGRPFAELAAHLYE